eukprot:scaffold8008_cov34-Tisochrysis_lutea.AAC.1
MPVKSGDARTLASMLASSTSLSSQMDSMKTTEMVSPMASATSLARATTARRRSRVELVASKIPVAFGREARE